MVNKRLFNIDPTTFARVNEITIEKEIKQDKKTNKRQRQMKEGTKTEKKEREKRKLIEKFKHGKFVS